jgi:hypothetical protein
MSIFVLEAFNLLPSIVVDARARRLYIIKAENGFNKWSKTTHRSAYSSAGMTANLLFWQQMLTSTK